MQGDHKGLSFPDVTKDGLDDSARGVGVDLEKAGAKSEGSSARGSAQFLADVESRRSIKVRPSTTASVLIRRPALSWSWRKER